VPSSADTPSSVDDALTVLTAVLARPGAVVLIDGRSGAGKTTFAARLAAAAGRDVVRLALDDVYPGWDGLRAGADAVIADVLAPLRAGRPGAWTAWDWAAESPGDAHTVPAGSRLIVEGAGILTPVSAALADATVWIDAPDEVRRRRALARDGQTYAPHWERWARQEDDHLRRHRPQSLATLRVAGD
jgi:uridine kinase